MLNKINSTTTFGRKQDIECVHQARKTLSNIFHKYVKNNMAEEDVFGDVLLLDRVGITQNATKNRIANELELFAPGINKKTSDLASDEKIKKMSLAEVQGLLKRADKTLKENLKSRYENLEKAKNKLTPSQKGLLQQMKAHIESVSLISIPKK